LDAEGTDLLGHRSELDHVQLVDVDLSHRDLRGSSWSRTVIGGSVASSDLADSILTDVRFDQVDCANLSLRNGSLVRVEFNGGRLLGLSMPEALIRDVVFRDTQLDLAGMRFASLDRVAFCDCRMHELDLSNATLQSVLFENCDMTGVDLSNATFDRCELRACTLEGVRGARDFTGVSMPLVDIVNLAPVFAGACGVRVLD
jgi:uncharacterized protein YjbI with pentapeptide repeats